MRFLIINFCYCFAGFVAVFQPGGGLPGVDRIPRISRELYLRLDRADPGGRLLVRPPRPGRLRAGLLSGRPRLTVWRTQRPARRRRPVHLDGRPLPSLPRPPPRRRRLPRAQLRVRLQSSAGHHPRRAAGDAGAVLRGERSPVLIPAGEVRRAGGGYREPGPAEWGQVPAMPAGLRGPMRREGGGEAGPLVELDRVEGWEPGALRR